MTDKQYGILGTIIIHSILLLLLLFSILSLPKPAPPEGGLLINFGDVAMAGGPAEPALNNLLPPPGKLKNNQNRKRRKA